MNSQATPHVSASAALYSPGQMAGATFLGTPLAGAWLLGANYGVLGDNGARRNAVLWGLLATVLVLASGFILPDNFPNYVPQFIQALAMQKVAERFQGDAYESHIGVGGRQQSSWRALGVGIAPSVVTAALAIVWTMFIYPLTQ